MQASPLTIHAYFLKKVNFSLIDKLENFSVEQKDFDNLDLSIKDETTLIDKTNQNWRSEVTVDAKAKKGAKVPYTFSVVMVGFFSVHPDYPEEKRKMMVEANAPAILYSSIREIVYNMTSKNPFPIMLLPSVMFLKPPEETQAVKNEPKPDAKKKPAVKKK